MCRLTLTITFWLVAGAHIAAAALAIAVGVN